MTIAIDIRSLQGRTGGVAEYTYGLVKTLIDTEQTHHYILFTAGYKSLHTLFPSFGPHHEVVHLAMPNKLLHASLFLLRRPSLDLYIEARTGKKLDIFFMPNIHFCSFSGRIKIILTIHDISFELYPWLSRLRTRLWHWFIRPRALLKRADHILAVSKWTSHDLEKWYAIPNKKLTVTPLASSFRQSEESYEELPPDLGGRRFFLLLAAHEKRKNADAVIEAFVRAHTLYPEAMNGVLLVLTGYCTDTQRMIDRVNGVRGFTQFIRSVGSVKKSVRDALISSATALLYPSMYEGFGIPLLEASLSRIPIIASSRASIGEVIDSAALLIDPYNCGELAFAMHSLLTDEVLRASLKKNQTNIVGNYSWERTSQITRTLFEYAHRN